MKGITVDTFSELRVKKNERLEETETVCFICGIEQLTFDRYDSSHGFFKHIRTEHNMWNYLYFFIYLWEQDKDDDDGMEQFVRRCLDKNDIAWFPIGRALCLNQESRDEIQEVTSEYGGALRDMNKKVMTTINELETAIALKVTSIENVYTLDHHSNGGSVASSVKSLDANSLASEFKRLSSRSTNSKSRKLRQNALTRAMTMNRRDYGILHHSEVNMEPLEITGIGSLFDDRDHGLVSARVICATGIYDLPRSKYKDGVSMKFDPSEICVCSNYSNSLKTNEEFIKIQILINDTIRKRFIGQVEFPLAELVANRLPSGTGTETIRTEKQFTARYGDKVIEGTFVFLFFIVKTSQMEDIADNIKQNSNKPSVSVPTRARSSIF